MVRNWPIPLSDCFVKKRVPLLASNHGKINYIFNSNNEIIIRVITWNQQSKIPSSPYQIQQNLTHPGIYHIIAFGAEECENSIFMSAFKPSKEKWENALNLAIGSDYGMIRSHALQSTHLIIYAHKAILHLISDVKSTAISTGLCNTLGNKGGIGISFCMGHSSFCFVNAHLSAHQYKTKRRISDFSKISNGLAHALAENKFHQKPQNIKGEKDMINPLIDMFDYIFWAGDMNFRINSTREIVDGLLRHDMHEELLHNDELTMLLQFNPMFTGYREGPLNFRPTYKFRKGTDEYDPSKRQRVPSWTDRILYKDQSHVKLLSYNSANELKMSDHRPVYATFSAKINPFEKSHPVKMYFWQQQSKSISQTCCIS